MGELRDQMQADMWIGGFSGSTTKIYLLYARQFARFHGRSPAELGQEEVRQFLHHLARRPVSRGTMRQVRAALTFLYAVTLNRPVEVEWLPTQRSTKRVPVVLSGTEVGQVMSCVQKDRYRLPMLAMYSAGLRIREACRLRVGDIDSKRNLIRVEQSKGKRDRYTLLSRRFLVELRAYWVSERPPGPWLFPGRSADGHLGMESVRRVFREAVRQAGIEKRVTPHSLRHSFATHLRELGLDVSVIQSLLGHANLKTTSVYLHTTVEALVRTKSPLDHLGTADGRVLG